MSVVAEIRQKHFTVHAPCSVELVARTDFDLALGDKVEFQFPHSWSLVNGPSFTRPVQGNDPAGAHYVNVSSPTSNALFEIDVRKRTLHYPEGVSRHGIHLVATLRSGKVPAGEDLVILYTNTFAAFIAETETVWLQVKGERPARDPELITTPGPAESLRVLAPSCATIGRPFGVLVASLDRFENASSTAYRDEPLTLTDGTVVAPPLTFTGCVRVAVTLEQAGVYRFRFRDKVSNAVRVAESCAGPYWGDLHIHTKLSQDGQGTEPYRYARDVSALDFAGAADHTEALGPKGYRTLLDWARRANAPGRFATILADERNPHNLTGHHNIYYRDEEVFLGNRYVSSEHAREPAAGNQPLDPARHMVVPHHTGIGFGGLKNPDSRGTAVDFDAWEDPTGLRPVMEIYSHHGQCDMYNPQHALAYEFNRTRRPERRSNTSIPGPFYAQDYWMKGLRLGVIGSSDEHAGQGGRRHGGIAAVWANALTREAIFDAIRARHCYATTGERILVDFTVDGIPMGESSTRPEGQELKIALKVWGTDLLVRVEILRFRFGQDTAFRPIFSDPPRPERLEAEYEATDTFTGPCMYYARITQEPLEWPDMAWTSPVWVDV